MGTENSSHGGRSLPLSRANILLEQLEPVLATTPDADGSSLEITLHHAASLGNAAAALATYYQQEFRQVSMPEVFTDDFPAPEDYYLASPENYRAELVPRRSRSKIPRQSSPFTILQTTLINRHHQTARPHVSIGLPIGLETVADFYGSFPIPPKHRSELFIQTSQRGAYPLRGEELDIAFYDKGLRYMTPFLMRGVRLGSGLTELS